MKSIKNDIAEDNCGSMTLVPEENEDLWHLYNIIAKGDAITGKTFRKVQQESTTGAIKAEKKLLRLTLRVESVQYEADESTVRVSGKNLTDTPGIKLGQYHTIKIALNYDIRIWKSFWDSVVSERVRESLDMKYRGEVSIVLIEAGLANLLILSKIIVRPVLKIQMNIPKNRGIQSNRDVTVQRFFKQILDGMLQKFDFEVTKCLVLAGPGFTKDDFFDWMKKEAKAENHLAILSNIQKVFLARASTASKHALKELLSDPEVKSKIATTSSCQQYGALNELYTLLSVDPYRACYGPAHIKVAASRGAIKTLFVTERLFRSSNKVTRKRYVELTEDVKAAGGEVMTFPDLHVSGEQLMRLSGIAAILRYPMPELEDIDDSEESKSFPGEDSKDAEGIGRH